MLVKFLHGERGNNKLILRVCDEIWVYASSMSHCFIQKSYITECPAMSSKQRYGTSQVTYFS